MSRNPYDLEKDKQAFRERAIYKRSNMIDNDIRDQKINQRFEALQRQPFHTTIQNFITYGQENKDLNGGRQMWSLAVDYDHGLGLPVNHQSPEERLHSWEFGVDETYTRMGEQVTYKEDICRTIAEISVKESKVTDLYIDRVMAEELDGYRKQTDSQNTYEYVIPVAVRENKLYRTFDDQYIGAVDDKFEKTHALKDNMAGDLIIVDYSNGKCKNLSVRVIIDLAQDNGSELTVQKDMEQDDVDAFAAAVASIPADDKCMEQ